MDLGKSLRLAMAHNGVNNAFLVKKMNVMSQQVTNWKNSGTMTIENLKKVAACFDMKVSEFIALGE